MGWKKVCYKKVDYIGEEGWCQVENMWSGKLWFKIFFETMEGVISS